MPFLAEPLMSPFCEADMTVGRRGGSERGSREATDWMCVATDDRGSEECRCRRKGTVRIVDGRWIGVAGREDVRLLIERAQWCWRVLDRRMGVSRMRVQR